MDTILHRRDEKIVSKMNCQCLFGLFFLSKLHSFALLGPSHLDRKTLAGKGIEPGVPLMISTYEVVT